MLLDYVKSDSCPKRREIYLIYRYNSQTSVKYEFMGKQRPASMCGFQKANEWHGRLLGQTFGCGSEMSKSEQGERHSLTKYRMKGGRREGQLKVFTILRLGGVFF